MKYVQIFYGANLMECEFYDIENLDVYFSGTMYLMTEDKRYILDFGYDIEFRRLKLINCNNPIHNLNGEFELYSSMAPYLIFHIPHCTLSLPKVHILLLPVSLP